jgi:hypothetical protein
MSWKEYCPRNRHDYTRSVTRLAGRVNNYGSRIGPGREREWARQLSKSMMDALRATDAAYPITTDGATIPKNRGLGDGVAPQE